MIPSLTAKETLLSSHPLHDKCFFLVECEYLFHSESLSYTIKHSHSQIWSHAKKKKDKKHGSIPPPHTK